MGLYSVFKDLFKDLTMAVIGSCYVIHLKALNSDSLAVKLADPSQSTSFWAHVICELRLYSVLKDLFENLTMTVIGSCCMIHL